MNAKTTIPNAGAVIILDCLQSSQDINEVSSLLKKQKTIKGLPLYLIDEAEETACLKAHINKFSFSVSSTLFLYPGKSAQQIQAQDFSHGYTELQLHAKRQWDPKSNCDPIITVGNITEGKFIDSTVENIVVVDDVISSGTTLSQVYRNTAWKFPRAAWHAVTLCSRKERLSYFEQVYCSFLIQDINGKKPPINSLSTLMDNQGIRESYIRRNFLNAEMLIKEFNELISK